MKVVFFGTPDFASTSLAALHANAHEVLAVVTAPDRLGGRGGRSVIVSDVKHTATRLGIPVLQPTNLKSARFLRELASYAAELFVVVAFRMLPEAVWAMPPLGSVNVHGSLLPAYRGAAPIHWALRHGALETGVSIFFLRHAIDTGDLLHQRRLGVGPDENVGELYERLRHLGAEALIEALDKIARGQTVGNPQDDALTTHAPKLTRENTRLDWTLPAEVLHNEVRGLSPSPLAWTLAEDQEVKLLRTRRLTTEEQQELRERHAETISTSESPDTALREAAGFGESRQGLALRPGTLTSQKLRATPELGRRLFVLGGDQHWLEVVELRPAGKGTMSGVAWANGAGLGPTSRFH